MKIKSFQELIILFILLLSYINCDLVIIGPSDLNSRFYNKPIEIVFGKMSDISNFYVHGEIYFESKTELHAACSELGTLSKNLNENEYSENFKILLAYNGQCSVVQKARNAQNAGASMLLLINDNDKDIKEILLEDDGSGSDIKIPVGLISLADGRIIQNYIENNPKSRIMVEINFQQKAPKKKIEFKLFFSSSELRAYELINNITKYIDRFSGQVDFIPIYVTHQSPVYDPENAKRELNCVSKGKYCYFPKETTIIQDGQRILLESLRQKCMYSISKDKIKYYYEYLQTFYTNCLIESENIKFNERCAKETLDTLGYPITYLDDCVAESFGVNSLLSSSYIDNENSIFKEDYNEILKYKLTSFPAAVVDDRPIEGIITESKIIISICKSVSVRPFFCTFMTGETDEHRIKMNRKKTWIYILIIVVIIINIYLFCTFRKYIVKGVNKIDFNTNNINKKVHNFLDDYMSNKKNQEMDYRNFDTDISSKNNKGYSKIEGTVNSI